MAATAAALATFITSSSRLISSHKLVELTRYGESSSLATVDSTVLTNAAQQAIYWFETFAGTYDPDTYPWHYVVAAKRTISELYLAAEKPDLNMAYQKMAEDDLANFRKRRTLYPQDNSTTQPTARTTGPSAFDDSIFGKIIPN